ncbi:PREDICTED: uncharacterized protein LOC106125551 [Papilio xuthus]|uniref:Uncharacterized protein LOC106125551 n=2 Tax=Papilio xuthus TaxID=66420 RepID=A0AAJ6ZSB9_PAPXU|nr:PREDICTED: uncharacterized protein LOC106125551 [Papilio xuthus]
MKYSIRLQLLTCLVYASCVHGIMVKYGTKGGPIEPPTPEPTPAPQPYRIPAPVWEERSDDSPDPNATWRPPFFRPQPRYTEIIYKVPPQTINSAQSFVNSYLPNQPLKAQTVTNYFTPAQILTSQNLPGVGIRYFIPAYQLNPHVKTHKKQEDAKHNDIETNEIDDSYDEDAPSDVQWKFEKDAAKSSQQISSEGTARPVYRWPVYVQPRH